MNKGKLYLLDVRNIDNPQISHVKTKLFVVRSVGKATSIIQRGWVHVPSLSPSPKLFNQYLALKKEGRWTKLAFDNSYTPEFLFQMKEDVEMKKALNRIRDLLLQGNDVALCCFCEDGDMCHTSLIGHAFGIRGFEVTELRKGSAE